MSTKEKVFLSPSSQIYNSVVGGGTEQQYARIRSERAATVLRAYGFEVMVSPVVNDDRHGYERSVHIANQWNPNWYIADHTNAIATKPNTNARGVHNYCWLSDPNSVKLGKALGRRMDAIIGGTHQIRDGQHLYEVRGPRCTSVLTENGFHDNAQDAKIIRTKPIEMGNALAYGFLDFRGIKHNAGAPTTTEPAKKTTSETIKKELIKMYTNSGFYWVDGKVYHYMIINLKSGFIHEFNNGGAGPLPGSYINPVAQAFNTPSFAQISKSQANKLRQDVLNIRTGSVELSGSVTLDGTPS